MTTTDFLSIELLDESDASAQATINEALTKVDHFLDGTRTVTFKDDFFGRTSVNGSPFIESASGTGADVDTNVRASEPSHPGIASLTTGTDSTGYASLVTRNQSCIALGGGVWKIQVVFLVPTLSDGTDTYTMRLGLGDSTVGAAATDGVLIDYTHSVNSGKFRAVTRSNSTETATDTGVTVAIDTWYRLDVVVNADASEVEFWLREGDTGDPTLVATHSTNIPTGVGRETGVQLSILKSAGTSARLLHVDYTEGRCELTDPR